MSKRFKKHNISTKTLLVFSTFISILAVVGCSRPELAAGILASTLPSDNNSQSDPQPSTPEPTPTDPATDYSVAVKDIATKSSCAQYSWADRGRAPLAYMKGMALTYARSLCRLKVTPVAPVASILKSANSGDASKDVLSHYADILASAGLKTNQAGLEPLHATYVIGIGLGMRESSGRYCTGWDTAAGSNRSSDEGEAGLFQQSYNSISASSELKKLYDEYQADESRCQLTTFKEGVTCSTQSLLGTGAGADFQAFIKRCPAFAAEYAMTLIRILRSHFGPINRHDAQVVHECDLMLQQVQTLVEAHSEAACAQLF